MREFQEPRKERAPTQKSRGPIQAEKTSPRSGNSSNEKRTKDTDGGANDERKEGSDGKKKG